MSYLMRLLMHFAHGMRTCCSFRLQISVAFLLPAETRPRTLIHTVSPLPAHPLSQGMLRYPNGESYEGSWLHGRRREWRALRRFFLCRVA